MSLERLGHGIREEPGRPRGTRALDDGGDADAADGEGNHGDKLLDRPGFVNVRPGFVNVRHAAAPRDAAFAAIFKL